MRTRRLERWKGFGAVLPAEFRFGWRRVFPWLLGLLLSAFPLILPVRGQELTPELEEAIRRYKQMGLHDLLNEPVGLATRTPKPWFRTPSAIQVVPAEDIRRLPVTSIEEALRLAGNLQVAQVNSHDWAITARGFNSVLANKLLVMIDGRAIYTPLYAGVFWDVQNPMLENIDRIEVVSGPGAALWGANAVNGVINIVTRSARDTLGGYAEVGLGSFLNDSVQARYGGRVGNNLYYRVYGQHQDRDGAKLPDGRTATNDWSFTEGGLRMDWYPSDDSTATLKANFYGGRADSSAGNALMDGQNVLGRWRRALSLDSDIQVQVYFDRTWREMPTSISEELNTYDIDVQHRFPMGDRHDVVWGAGYRFLQDRVRNSPAAAFLPADLDFDLLSGFVQDEIEVVPELVRVTLGSRFEYNDFSGFEVQPSARVAWTPTDRQTVWAAISRAVRSPSRIDRDFHVPPPPVPPGTPSISGGPNFVAEKLMAYELGYRLQVQTDISFSLATYYHRYSDLRSVDALETGGFILANHFEGEIWGMELAATWQTFDWWRLRAAYNYLNKELWPRGGTSVNPAVREGNDPDHQFSFQSIMDLPANFQLGVTGRYVDALPSPFVPSYFTMDVRLSWQVRDMELSIIGQNLLDKQHPEFGSLEIPRSVYGKVSWHF